MRKCTVFVGYRRPSDGTIILGGSAFWVLRPMPDFPDENLAYLVTAAHVIRKITDMNIDKIILRLNFTDGNWGAIETQPSSWFFHEDPAADVAVLRIGFDVREHDHRGWELRYSATPEEVQKHGIGPGDDLFFIGLFTKHYGTTKNIPIVRMGNIAAMPSIDNPVKTKIGPMIAYLAEARSIGGLSGSPVFVDIYGALRRGPFQLAPGNTHFLLLGLVHGHYDETEDLNDDDVIDDGLKATKVNVGIAVVIPVERVIEVIANFSESEKADSRARLNKMAPVNDRRS